MEVSCPLCGSPFKTPVNSSGNGITSSSSPGSVHQSGVLYGSDAESALGKSFSWHTTVAGISYNNNDGVSRQLIAQNCQAGEHITLSLEANNPHSPDATMLCRSNGEQLGYFKSKIGERVRKALGSGSRYDIYVVEVTGRTHDKTFFGITLHVFEFHPNDHEEAAWFIEDELAKEGLTPLYRPSPDLLERTKVRRIFT